MSLLNFRDINALYNVLEVAYQQGAGDVGRNWLRDALISELNFSPQQANTYVSVVMSVNNEKSRDWVLHNCRNLIGSWKRANTNGSEGNYFSSSTETRIFNSDLTYTIRTERLESYSNPFGGGFSNPSVSERHGIWAPIDVEGQTIQIVTIENNDAANILHISFPNYSNSSFNSITILNRTYVKW